MVRKARLAKVRPVQARWLQQFLSQQPEGAYVLEGNPQLVIEPTVSASMATALRAYSGIAVKMLVDQRPEAHLLTMFMVDYQPGGVAHPHDHPFEEAYFMLEGEVEGVADGRSYVPRPGDVFWTGVGSIHAFHNRTDSQHTC